MSDDIKDGSTAMGENFERLRDCPSLAHCRKQAARIEALEAQLADTEGRLAANRALVDLRDKRLSVAETQLAGAREALEVAEAAYDGLCGRIGYDEYQKLEDRATELRRAVLETCSDCGAREPCDDDCPNYVDPPAAAAPAAAPTREEIIEQCAKIADEYVAQDRFSVHDEAWQEHSPSEVYATAAIDVGNWIAKEIRSLALKSAPHQRQGE